MSIIINSFISLVTLLANIYIWVIIIAAVLSFVNPDPRNQLVELINRLTQPVFSFVRQKLPFVVVSGIDLSPIVIIFALDILIGLLNRLYI